MNSHYLRGLHSHRIFHLPTWIFDFYGIGNDAVRPMDPMGIIYVLFSLNDHCKKNVHQQICSTLRIIGPSKKKMDVQNAGVVWISKPPVT